MLILGASVLVAGFITLTAFDGKTLEQQKAEIAQMITMKLDELRMTKEQECTDKVNTEAQRRFDEIVAQRAAEAAAKPGKKPKKPAGPKGPSADPQPVTPPPTTTTDPKKDKMQGGTNVEEKKDKMQGQPSTTDKKKAKMQGGGGGN